MAVGVGMGDFMLVQPVLDWLVAASAQAPGQILDAFGDERHVIQPMFVQHRLGQGQFQQRVDAERAPDSDPVRPRPANAADDA